MQTNYRVVIALMYVSGLITREKAEELEGALVYLAFKEIPHRLEDIISDLEEVLPKNV